MDNSLRNDLERFCRVYQGNIADILKENLPRGEAEKLGEKLDEEFDLFRESLFNRLRETL